MAETRYYPGYEDYSVEGRARIRGFNKGGGGDYLSQGSDLRKYKAGVRAGETAVREQASTMDARDLRNPNYRNTDQDIDLQRLHAEKMRFYGIGK